MLVSIQAGNSDNKLTQWEWSNFVTEISNLLNHHETARHFFGGSPTWAGWQNVCFVCEIVELEPLCEQLATLRAKYQQDSVCVLAGEARFV
jgi:hypothetical protein